MLLKEKYRKNPYFPGNSSSVPVPKNKNKFPEITVKK